MKLTRRAARRVQLAIALRAAEKNVTPKVDWDTLFEYVIPIK